MKAMVVSVASYLSVDDYSSSSHLLPLLTEKSWNDNDDDDEDRYVLQRKYLPIPFQISSSENKEAIIALHFYFKEKKTGRNYNKTSTEQECELHCIIAGEALGLGLRSDKGKCCFLTSLSFQSLKQALFGL